MGIVWRAHDELLDRPVAVKEVLYHPISEEDRREFTLRTMREARAAGRIDHPNVVVVHDVIEEDGRPWIVMQLVKARSLGEVLREHGPLVPERAAAIGLQVLDALRTAHASGVLHRDVKPENVLISADNRVVLTDFGIATLPDETTLTTTGSISGTAAFLPPERLKGRPATPESDLWSLGATLYAAVEGRAPFDRGTPIATMAAVLNDELEPPRRAGALAPVIEGLLRKDPVERIDAVEAADLLTAAAAGEQIGPRPAPTAPPPVTDATAPVAPGAPDLRAGRRVIVLGLLPLLAATALGAGGWYGYRMVKAQPLAAPPTPTPRPSAPSASPSPGHDASPSPSRLPSPAPGKLPRGWRTHRDPLGFSMALPRGWAPYRREAARVWFRGPNARDYLLIDLTPWEEDDPVAQLTRVERTSTARNLLPGYERVRLEPGRYLGVPAADWEFTFTPSHGKVRVLDRGFRLADGRCFAIYWQVLDSRWTTGLSYFRVFTSTFRPG